MRKPSFNCPKSTLQDHDDMGEPAADADLPWVYPNRTRNAICGLQTCNLYDKNGEPCTFLHVSRQERIRARGAWYHHNQGRVNQTEEAEETGGQRKRLRHKK